MWLHLKILCFIRLAGCFYVPGNAPMEFKQGDAIDIKAVKMTSSKTQLPFDYYSLAFCAPKDFTYTSENLGEILRGDRIVNTPYKVNMLEVKTCAVLCSKDLNEKESKLFAERVLEDYSVHMLIDNLPAATNLGNNLYGHGFKLGLVDLRSKTSYINNHLQFIIKYNQAEGTDTYRVVGFEVIPKSVEWSIDSAKEECTLPASVKYQLINPSAANRVIFTYSVTWESSDIRWALRWDNYLRMADVRVHWFSIINSIVIVLFLSGILAMIMVRTLRRDIAKYNQNEEDLEEAIEETGWKLVHGDVFRPPKFPLLLSALVGSGVQIFFMVLITLVFSMLGMLSPASRGSLMTAIIVLYVFMGVFAGFYAGRLYKTLHGSRWKRAAFVTAVFYPGLVFGVSFFLNFFLWGKNSSGAVPFTTMIALVCLWFGVSFPLVFIGYFFGYRKQPYSHPVRTNQIPRQIPEQVWYMQPAIGMLLAGVLPFGAVFIELYFILGALWENQVYYLFGFLFLVFVILCLCCSEISIVMIYFQLCSEDYRWWWRSFLMSGSCAIYVFLYAIYYFVSRLEIVSFVSCLLYFGYSLLMVVTFWLITGTVGFYATYKFVGAIYAAVKID